MILPKTTVAFLLTFLRGVKASSAVCPGDTDIFHANFKGHKIDAWLYSADLICSNILRDMIYEVYMRPTHWD